MGKHGGPRRIGVSAFISYLFLLDVALLVLVGIAASWWLASLIAGITFAGLVTAFAAMRSRGFLGRVFGTTGWDPFDYAQWTWQLVVKPIVISLPVSLVLIVAAFLVPYDTPLVAKVVIYTGSAVVGFVLGGWLSLWLEKRRQARESTSSTSGRRGPPASLR